MSRYSLVVWRCHCGNTSSLCLDTATGGQRLTSFKCCGRWDKRLHEWQVTAAHMREIVIALECAIDEDER